MLGIRCLLFITILISMVNAQSGKDFISYHLYATTGGISAACDFYSPQSKWAGYITANVKGLPCNTCVKMTAEKTGNVIFAVAIDTGGRGFDLNQPAFCELCGEEGGFAAGGCNVNWEVVPSCYCDAWIAARTAPWCDLCPKGSTCGNPDPNKNGGVPWDTYCPQVASSDGMTRCTMRIDGCQCYGVTPATKKTALPTCGTSTGSSSGTATGSSSGTATGTATGSSSGTATGTATGSSTGTSTGGQSVTTRCGGDWGLANDQCNKPCQYPTDCPASKYTDGKSPNCYGGLKACVYSGTDTGGTATGTATGSSSGTATGTATGSSSGTATGSSSGTATGTATGSSTGTSTGQTITTRCGGDWGLANNQCNKPCQYPTDCPASKYSDGKSPNCYGDLKPCVWYGAIEDQSVTSTSTMSQAQDIGMVAGIVAGIIVLAIIIVVIYWKNTSKIPEEIV